MKVLMKGFLFIFIWAAAVSVASGYSNPVEGGGSQSVTNDWDAGFQLTVGRWTANNTLVITNGGAVFDGVGIIGELSGSDGNQVVVSGSGSSWTNVADLAVGNAGSSNTMIVEDGGVVYNANGVIGVEEDSAGNSVTVRGTNSVWHNSDTLIVGRKGDGNSLVVSDGATVNSHFAAIGFENPADGNTVTITGDGSVWNNSGDMLIGSVLNSGNSLTIENGGKAVIGGQLSIYDDLYLNDGGWLRIDGHSDLVTGNRFHYNSGSTLEVTGSVWFNGDVADRNTLIFQGGNAAWLGSGVSTLSIGNDSTVIISNRADISVWETGIDNDGNLLLVTGEGSSFSTQTNLYVGHFGSDNELRVMNGAAATAVTGYVGYASSADNNRIIVEGEGSYVESTDALFLGYDAGLSNRLEVLGSGTVDVGTLFVGHTNARYSAALVDGSGSTLSANEIQIGTGSGDNTFAVLNGGQATSGTAAIGSGTNGNNNVAIVSGDGSFWDAGSLTIGGSDTTNYNNSLTVENGGMVTADEIIISTNGAGHLLDLKKGGWLKVTSDMDAGMDGFNWESWSTLEVQGTVSNLNGWHDGINTLILSGGGIWSNDTDVAVGFNNSSNRLRLVDGGTIIDSYGTIGQNAASDFNTVEITGSGSIWSNYSDFIVGEFGADNMLSISNSGAVSVWDDTIVGAGSGADRNAVYVRGSGSHLYSHFGTLVLGYFGSSNMLSATDGGLVTSGSGILGLDLDSGNNRALIDGPGSKWSMSSSLRVGLWGADNDLSISNGGAVSAAGSVYIGDQDTAEGNRLLVDGADSRVVVTLNMHVGHQGSGNELNIFNGAQVYNDIGLLGTDSGADRNRALIEGPGSIWYNRHTFFAGNSGSSNSVTILNGAELSDTTGYIGYHTNAGGNRVTVDNASWTNRGGLFVGFNGSGNSLVITNSAKVASGESRIGAEGFANNNQVLVTGGGSVWNISRSLWVGNDVGTNNTLTVENGGRIVVDENVSVGMDNRLNVNDGGTVTVYGNTVFTDGFNIGSGGTFETFGGISGIGGTLESGRTLRLAGSGASWHEPGDILLESGSTLDIGAGAVVSTPSNYTQQADATLRFGMATNSADAPVSGSLNVGQVADLADGADFIFASDIGSLSFEQTYTNTLVTADTLVVGGRTNAVTADLEQYLDTDGTLVGLSFYTENDDILAIINRIGLSGGLGPDNDDLRAVLDEIDARASAGDPLANRQLGIINALSSEQALAELTQFYTRGIPTYRHMDGLLQGLRQITKRTSAMLMDTADYVRPVGAYGPAAALGPWRGWAGAYGENGSRDASGSLSGYDAAVYGTAMGLDRAFDNVVIGLSGGLAGSSLDQDDGDTSDASTAYGALYATVRLKEVDWDLIGSYGNSSIENSSGTVFGSDAETDASTMVFYISASEEAVSGPFTFAPLVAFQAAHFDQEGYDEVSANAIGRDVDDYDRWSYKSILGATAGTVKPMEAFDLIIRGRASWQHEFNTDVDTLNYRLIGGTDPHYFTIQAPVKDIFDVGIHVSALIGGRFEVGAGLDGRFSDEYSAASYNARIQYTF